jgi:hypothetical protein
MRGPPRQQTSIIASTRRRVVKYFPTYLEYLKRALPALSFQRSNAYTVFKDYLADRF